MTFTLTFEWWWIPTALTVLAFAVWVIFTPEESGMLAGIGALFTLIPTLFFVLLVWLVAAIAKLTPKSNDWRKRRVGMWTGMESPCRI